MKNLKKMLSVIVVIAMLATTMLPAFAADTAAAPKTEADIVKALGVVIGGEDGITDEYLQATTLRYQSAIIFLRLIGLEADAREYAGEDNFADANTVSADTKKYLGYLKTHPEYGWIGIGNNMFDPNSATSAQAFYKVLLETLGYKCTVGDVQGDFDYANTIAFAAEKGLAKVANVDKFTNADLITAVLEVLPLEKKGTGKTLLKTLVEAGVINEEIAKEYLPDALELQKTVTTEVYSVAATNGQLTVVLTEDVGATPAASDFTITQAINGGAATTVTGTVYSYTYETKTVVIDVPVVAEASEEQNVVYSVQYKDTTAVAAPAIVVGAAFGIKDIVEPSLKLIKVNLNKDYDSSKDTFSVYKTSDTSATVAITAKAVTENSKQVLVIANGKFDADVDYTLKLTRDGKDYTKAFKVAADVTVPQLVSVKAIGNKIIRATFSEPVENADAANAGAYNYKIGDKVIGTDYAVTDVKVSDDFTSVDIKLANILETGEYTFAIVRDNTTDVIDYAGYYVPAMSAKFTVTVSLTAAQVKDLTVNSRSEVVVEFTDPVEDPATSTVFWNTDGSDSNTYKAANEVAKRSDTKYAFSFTTNVIPTGKVYFFVKGVVDAYGNSVPTRKFEVEVGADAIATATVTVENETTVKVKYSKDMQNNTAINSGTAGDAANRNHYTVKKADGTAVTISKAEYVSADKTVILTLSDTMSGDCKISISGVLDVVGQAVQAISDQVISFTDKTSPTVTNVYAGGTKIYVVYSEPMATSGAYSVLTAGNYKWTNSGGSASPSVTLSDLPSGTTIALSSEDPKAIVISLPSSTVLGTTVELQIGYISGSTIKAVTDVAGNVLPIGSPITATTEPTATISGQELKITSASTFRVKVDGKKLTNVSPVDFRYTLTGTFTDDTTDKAPSTAKLVDDNGTQYIEFTLASGDSFNSATNLGNFKVKTLDSGISTNTVTALGNAIEAGAISAACSSTSFTTSIKSVAILDATHINVILDGEIDSANAKLLAGQLQVTQGSNTIAVDANNSDIIGSGYSSVIKIQTTSALDITGSVLVKTLPAAYITAVDKNNQAIVANTTGLTGSAVFMVKSIAKVASNIEIEFNMVPKLPSTYSVTAAADQKSVVIENIGTIAGFDDDAAVSTPTVTVSGMKLIITGVSGTGNVVFTPDSAFTNNSGAAVNTDVKAYVTIS